MHPRQVDVCSTGYPELDEWLQGGMPEKGVLDIHTDIGIGEIRLFLPYLQARQEQHQRLLVFVAPPLDINGEMLVETGFDLSKVLIIKPQTQQEALWAAEQCLKSGCCHTLLSWISHLEIHQVKRLQLAAKQGSAVQLIFRQQQQHGVSLPVTMGMSLQSRPEGLTIKVNKRIGSWVHEQLDLDMRRYWPAFQLPQEQHSQDNIIPFPQRHAG